VSSFKKPGFGSEIPVLGPILHHRKVAILENREAGYSQVGYRPSRNQVPGRSFDSRPIGGPDFSRVREASTRKLGCRPSGNQVSDNKSRFLGRFYVIGKGAFKKSSKKPGLWFSDVGSTCGVVGAAVTAQGTYKPEGTQKSVGHGHPGVVQAPRTRRSRPPAPGSSGKSHQILPSRRRSRATMRPRSGCASPRHPPRGAPQPGVGQPVGGARTALVFRGLQNTFRDQQAGPSPQGRVPAMRGAVHHVSSRGGPGLHAQHVRPASARQARTSAAPQTTIGRWLCRGGSNGPSDQTDQACDWDHGCAHR